MVANTHAPSLSGLESSVSQVVGGNTERFSTNVSFTISATPVRLFYNSVASYLNLSAWNSAGSSGGSIQVYLGPDDSYPLYMSCAFAASECKVPLPTYVYSELGWSVYGTADGTNQIVIGHSSYNAMGLASVIVTDNVDNFLQEVAPTTNRGSETYLRFTNETAAAQSWPLLQFDLTAAAGITSCVSAVLSLRVESVDSDPMTMESVRISALLTDWSETQSTWNIRKTGVNWNVAGAIGGTDVRAANDWTGNVELTDETRIGFEITNLVNEWLNGSLTNNGLIMYNTYTFSGQSMDWYSRNHATASFRPVLNIQYRS
jgi:hypothetical protein